MTKLTQAMIDKAQEAVDRAEGGYGKRYQDVYDLIAAAREQLGQQAATPTEEERHFSLLKSLPGFPWLPCPVCRMSEGCSHSYPERIRAAFQQAAVLGVEMGTFRCPICNVSTPHHHEPTVVHMHRARVAFENAASADGFYQRHGILFQEEDRWPAGRVAHSQPYSNERTESLWQIWLTAWDAALAVAPPRRPIDDKYKAQARSEGHDLLAVAPPPTDDAELITKLEDRAKSLDDGIMTYTASLLSQAADRLRVRATRGVNNEQA